MPSPTRLTPPGVRGVSQDFDVFRGDFAAFRRVTMLDTTATIPAAATTAIEPQMVNSISS
ncbi:hypothetical protein ACFQ0P_02410 [Microbacterium insulae]|uniref:Uncharacterized protein n=1 Tax=Microbacterium insulae TaxID=483014 RepID=A0ABW3AF04_9MICO